MSKRACNSAGIACGSIEALSDVLAVLLCPVTPQGSPAAPLKRHELHPVREHDRSNSAGIACGSIEAGSLYSASMSCAA